MVIPKASDFDRRDPYLGSLVGVAFGLTIGHIDDIDRAGAKSGRNIRKGVVDGVGVEVRRGHKHGYTRRPTTARRQDQGDGYQQDLGVIAETVQPGWQAEHGSQVADQRCVRSGSGPTSHRCSPW